MFSVFSALDAFEARMWSYILKKTGGFEKNRFLGITRFVAIPITLFSAFISGILSHLHGKFELSFFLANTFGLIFAHAASNVINDVLDYKRGLDVPGYLRNIYGIHPAVVLGEKKALIVGLGLAFIALLFGIYISVQRGILILILAGLGFLILFSYSGPPFRFKYMGLGELIVFLVWGPLMIGGGYYAITGDINKEVLLASLPYGVTASLVLFGKHLDKLYDDERKGIRTLPVILGERRTKTLCKFLVLVPYLLVLMVALLSKNHWVILAFASLPRALKSFEFLDIPKPDSVEKVPPFYPKEFWPMWYVGGAFILNADFAIFYILGLMLSSLW